MGKQIFRCSVEYKTGPEESDKIDCYLGNQALNAISRFSPRDIKMLNLPAHEELPEGTFRSSFAVAGDEKDVSSFKDKLYSHLEKYPFKRGMQLHESLSLQRCHAKMCLTVGYRGSIEGALNAYEGLLELLTKEPIGGLFLEDNLSVVRDPTTGGDRLPMEFTLEYDASTFEEARMIDREFSELVRQNPQQGRSDITTYSIRL